MNIARVWAMPTADTFDCQPIGDMVRRYLRQSTVSIDPFARNKRWATYTNDLNPNTQAEYHMDALDFLKALRDRGILADLVIFDPPYSLEQLKRSYEGIGLTYTSKDGWKPGRWTEEYSTVYDLLRPGGVVLSFGWNSAGMGQVRGCSLEECLIVCHGTGHNDTICIAERKAAHQVALLDMRELQGDTDVL